jgi:predicted RNase H-like HicB family nuclease
MVYTYTALFTPEDGMYNVTFPDLPHCFTCGKNINDSIDMAKDVLNLWLYEQEENHACIPPASDPTTIKAGQNEFTSIIIVDTEDYRRYYQNILVKKTLNIPYNLNEQAKAANINFSQLLQKAIKKELGLPLSE